MPGAYVKGRECAGGFRGYLPVIQGYASDPGSQFFECAVDGNSEQAQSGIKILDVCRPIAIAAMTGSERQ